MALLVQKNLSFETTVEDMSAIDTNAREVDPCFDAQSHSGGGSHFADIIRYSAKKCAHRRIMPIGGSRNRSPLDLEWAPEQTTGTSRKR
jgi:hypothetical protein